jgi:hypothetical protein
MANPISASRADSFKRRTTNSRHVITRLAPAPSTTVMIHLDLLRIAANLEARASGSPLVSLTRMRMRLALTALK